MFYKKERLQKRFSLCQKKGWIENCVEGGILHCSYAFSIWNPFSLESIPRLQHRSIGAFRQAVRKRSFPSRFGEAKFSFWLLLMARLLRKLWFAWAGRDIFGGLFSTEASRRIDAEPRAAGSMPALNLARNSCFDRPQLPGSWAQSCHSASVCVLLQSKATSPWVVGCPLGLHLR